MEEHFVVLRVKWLSDRGSRMTVWEALLAGINRQPEIQKLRFLLELTNAANSVRN